LLQGENASFRQAEATSYEANLQSLLLDVRFEVGDPSLPVVIVRTGARDQRRDVGAAVAEARRRVTDRDRNAHLVETGDLRGFYH
jgi:hypothetical protein